MSFLQLKKLTKNFPGCVAVDQLDLNVEKGEFIVLLGPSGCGKTTTLRILAGLEIQTSGQVILDDRDISDVPPENRDVAMVFQNLALYPHMSVFDNIAFFLKNIRTPKPEIEKRVIQAAHRVEIEELLHRKPNQLSGGQRQRVALARALVRSPKLFLLDEPLAALDAKLRSSMRSEFKLLHRSLNEQGDTSGTFIYVTHDQIEALTLGTKVAVIHQGKVIQFSPPKKLYEQPNNLFVASFVGSPEMNLINGKIESKDNELYFYSNGFHYKVRGKGREILNRKLIQNNSIVMGIRPESVLISSTNDSEVIPCEILTIEPFGQTNFLRLKANNEETISSLVSPDLTIKEGEVVGVRFNQEAIHYFDMDTGENLLT